MSSLHCIETEKNLSRTFGQKEFPPLTDSEGK